MSASDTFDALREKVRQWLEAGSWLVWIVHPRSRTVEVHRPGGPPALLGPDASLSGEDVVPGFEATVRDLFPEDVGGGR